jgi:Na+/H+ antiporter NhaD/arsenite permease-like protein
MDVIKSLLRSRKFWLSVFGVVQAIVFQYVPGFPEEVWQSIAALVMVLVGAIALEDAALKVSSK